MLCTQIFSIFTITWCASTAQPLEVHYAHPPAQTSLCDGTMRALGLCVLSALLISVYYADLVITDSLPADSTDSNTWPGKERLLVLCKNSIWAFDLATGADQGEFLSKASTSGKTWGLDSIAEKDGLLYVGEWLMHSRCRRRSINEALVHSAIPPLHTP